MTPDPPQPPGAAPRRDAKEHAVQRHRLDPVSLGFGLLFAITGIVFLVGDVPAVDLRLVGPLVILALGLWLLLSVVLTGRRGDDEPAGDPGD